MSETDLELLARYTRHRAEAAFAELVRRHLGLVYSAALRQVRSPQLAEEVAQSTFLKLARHADELTPDTILSAWLYRVARRESIDVIRGEARRRLREQVALEMTAMNAPLDDWNHIAPLLDEAMHALDDADRTAVLLRYFENKSLREVGLALGTTDDTAQKRVRRAIERLRTFFSRRGVNVAASGLMVALSAHAVQAAPAVLESSIVTVAVAHAVAAGSSTSNLTHGALKIMAWTKSQTALAVGAAILLAGGAAKVAIKNSAAGAHAGIYEAIFAMPDSRSLEKLESAPPILILRPTRHPEKNGGIWSVSGKGVYVNASLAELIGIAHDIPPTRMILAAPMPPGTFDYLATLPGRQNDALRDEIRTQFKLSAHRESREIDALALQVKDADILEQHLSRGGEPACQTSQEAGLEKWTVRNERLARAVPMLEGYFQQPVLLQSGSAERYDFECEFPKGEGEAWKASRRKVILARLEEAGLALVPKRTRLELLVVEPAKD